MYNKNLISLVILTAIVSSCSWNSFRNQLGVGTKAPDEFLVEEKRDLTIPKEFTLPKPGELKYNERNISSDAENMLFGKSDHKNSKDLSSIEKSFMDKANLNSNDNIRNIIEDERKNQKSVMGTDRGSTLESIVDPFGYNRPKDKIVDGYRENQRVREAISTGAELKDDDVIVIDDW